MALEVLLLGVIGNLVCLLFSFSVLKLIFGRASKVIAKTKRRIRLFKRLQRGRVLGGVYLAVFLWGMGYFCLGFIPDVYEMFFCPKKRFFGRFDHVDQHVELNVGGLFFIVLFGNSIVGPCLGG